ncbi:aminopeptidase N-like protein [Tribolium castaneum]|uniref:Aminopeptidase n=3 Tax=Tribolium castaneum TaxID=7070 RepID=D6WBA9_TRICA|nr:aminopeptidase N-like protein [Tribolium castaneum]
MAFLKWFCFTILLTYVQSVPIEQQEAVEYRLPEGVIEVERYNLELTLKEDVFDTNVFSGTLEIHLKVLQSTNEIKLHANGITISTVTLTNLLVPVEIENESFESDEVTEILTIRTKTSLGTGTYVLGIIYEGKLRTDEMYGFYKSSYKKPDGGQVFLGTTQFQPTSARKAFPCFDEPSYKAVFDIKITHPTEYTAISNTDGTRETNTTNVAYTTTTFKPTPKMSTYLVAFVVSDYTCDETMIDDTTHHLVCSRSEAAPNRKIANEAGPKLVKVMEDWTGIKYSESGMTKMHQLAIPDFSAGAMENWGLLTYRETGLLWDEKESSNSYLQSIKNVIAHEITHMWFGNLVTTHWWSDTFLNEGFARYFQYHGTAEIEPSWELDKQFVVTQVQTVLASDSSPTSHAVSWPVSSPAQVSSRFNSISYNKGGSILRMMVHFMGAQNFQTGVRKYLNDNKFGNTKPENLWTALETTAKDLPPGTTLTKVIENWINTPGYPVLEVKSDGLSVTISQKRFLSSGEPNVSDKWYVPVSYTTSRDANKFEDTSAKAWLLPTEDLVLTNVLTEANDWIILNNQQTGYYRIDYDGTLWAKIKTALFATDFSGIHELNRAQIVDDYYNFAKIGTHSYSDLLELLKFLKNDISYYPWYSAFSAFSSMLARTTNDKIRESLSEYILDQMTTLYASVPFNEPKDSDQIYSLKRALAANWACRLGLKDCVDKAVAAFQTYKNSPKRPDKNLKSVIYCNGLRHSTDPESDWNYVWTDFTTVRLATEQATILSALGCAKNEAVLNKYLGYSIDSASGIRQQDALSVFSSVYTSNPEGVDIAFDFLLKNYRKIYEYYGSMNSISSLFSGLANRFTRKDQTDKLSTFLDSTTDLPESVSLAAQAALTNALANLEQTENFEKELKEYFGIETTTSSTTTESTTSSTTTESTTSSITTESTTSSTTTESTTSSTTTKSTTSSTTTKSTTPSDGNNSGTSLATGILTLTTAIFWLRFIF